MQETFFADPAAAFDQLTMHERDLSRRAAQLLNFPAQAVIGRRLWEVVRQRALQQVVRSALA